MKGIRYLVDEKGKRQAVLIDLKRHARLWDDFCDVLVSESRRKEPTVSLVKVKAQLRKKEMPR